MRNGCDNNRHRGFTLIEVLLSLGLAALVLVALATAVDVHLRCLQIGRTHTEEAQLARALLLRIEDDLHNAAVINPVDSSNIASASPSNDDQADGMAPASGDADAMSDDSDTTSDDSTTTEEDEYPIGLYGESDWMQIDVRRIPRLDQYDYETLPSGSELLPDVVSGIKTVYYMLGEDTGMASTGGEYRGGLIRREVDYALTRWAEDMGNLTSVNQELEPIAPEVTDIEFLYYDGSGWVDSWDSYEMGGLPLAVHVSLSIMPRDQFNRFIDPDTDSYSLPDTDTFIYSLTIALPVAEGDTSSATTEETTDDTSGDTSNPDDLM